jgi:hypothetical protein
LRDGCAEFVSSWGQSPGPFVELSGSTLIRVHVTSQIKAVSMLIW